MPVYEYKCKACGKTFEYFLKNSAEKVKCQKCGSTRLERLFSAFAVGVSTNTTSGGSSCPTGTCPLS